MDTRREVFASLWIVLVLAGCGSSLPLEGDPPELPVDGSVGVATEELVGRVDDGFPVSSPTADQEVCHPFAMIYMDRVLQQTTSALQTSAFMQCLQDQMAETAIPCPGDPYWDQTRFIQAQRIRSALLTGNHVEMNCDPDGFTDHAPFLGYGHDTVTPWTQSNWWGRQAWDTFAPYAAGEPFAARGSDVVHEYLHTHNYGHGPDGDCAAPGACASSVCSWTSVCGGSGTPPGTPYDGSAQDARNRCAVLAGLPDTEYDARVGGGGVAPMDQAADRCLRPLLAQSAAACSATVCNADEVALLQSWNGADDEFSGSCVCVPDQRHAASFVTGTGHYLTALGGSGSLLNAVGPGRGTWQTFYLVDQNGGALAHGDVVSIRTGPSDTFVSAGTAGQSVRADATSDGSALARWSIHRVLGAGTVQDGDEIGFRNESRFRFMTAINDGGTTVVSDAVALGDWERFTYREPRRAHLVQLQAHDSRFVSFDPTVSSELVTAAAASEYIYTNTGVACVEHSDCSEGQWCRSSTCQTWRANPAARRQSFWVIDHNGGALMPGDSVSIEWSGITKFWNSCTSGTGNLQGNGDYDSYACRRFTLGRVSGSGPITHGTQITIRSVDQARFLNAIPTGYTPAHRIRNEATVASTWERFTIRFAQEARF